MPRVVGPHQVAVIQFRLRLDLAFETGNGLRCGLALRQHLDGHLAIHHLVHGDKDLPHAALAQPVRDHVRTQVQLRTSLLQLLRLIVRQHSQLDQLGCQQFVTNLNCRQCIQTAALPQLFDRQVNLMLTDLTAQQRRSHEGGFGRDHQCPLITVALV